MTRLTISDILEAAQATTPVTIGEIIGQARFAYISRVRQACFYLAREQGYSFPAIGHRIGGKDHSTVIHGVRQCGEFMARLPIYAKTVADIRDCALRTTARRNAAMTRAVAELGCAA